MKVFIAGNHLSGATKVMFGTIPATINVVSDIQITVTNPAGSGKVDVTVTTPGGTSAITAADQFTYLYAKPAVTSISPNEGLTTGGTSVTITGTDFTGASQVLFGTVPASSFKLDSDTQITAVSPANTAGPVDVTVTTPGGTSATSSEDQFTYKPAPPTIASISPTEGPVGVETTVTIKGTGFKDATQVMFGTAAAISFTVNSDGTQITAVSPASSAAGSVYVTVNTPEGNATAADQFTYVKPAPPTMASISPNSGKAGDSVKIEGTGFKGATEVDFGNEKATITSETDTLITVTVPAVPPGTVNVDVKVKGSGGDTSNAMPFTYNP
jgi:hypothetical protein